MAPSWNDYNDAEQNAALIPKGTLAKVRVGIRPGGFDDPSQGWTGGYGAPGWRVPPPPCPPAAGSSAAHFVCGWRAG